MKRKKQILLFISCLLIFSIACNLPAIILEQIRIFLRIPIMVEEDSIREPANENASDPADENASELVDENASELVDENISNSADENNGEPDSEISIEDCVAKPDEYAWEFTNVHNDGSNDTKEVCRGDFFVRNTSDRVLHFKRFKYWDNGAMQDIGWEALCARLAPGEEFSQIFTTQTYSTGNIPETVATFTKLIVFYDLPECVVFLLDEENETLWDEFAIPLLDPCR